MTQPDVPVPGLNGVVVADTSIGDVRGVEGFFHYRGHSATELAERYAFEDVWRLVIDGALPTDDNDRRGFQHEVRGLRELPPGVAAALGEVVGQAPRFTDAVRSSFSIVAGALDLAPLADRGFTGRRADALRLGALVPVVVAAAWRARSGALALSARPGLGHAADFLWLLGGTEPDPVAVQALERYLILTIDHGLNASTFTARVVASTGCDLGGCLVAAFAALTGPSHGGALGQVLDLLDEIGDDDDLETSIRAKLDRGERLPGFGHAVYRTADPRTAVLADVASRLGGARLELAREIRVVADRLLAERKPERPLQSNVDYFAAVTLEAIGIPRPMLTAVFAIGRCIGWLAHSLEQADDTKLIRRSSRYVGRDPVMASYAVG